MGKKSPRPKARGPKARGRRRRRGAMNDGSLWALARRARIDDRSGVPTPGLVIDPDWAPPSREQTRRQVAEHEFTVRELARGRKDLAEALIEARKTVGQWDGLGRFDRLARVRQVEQAIEASKTLEQEPGPLPLSNTQAINRRLDALVAEKRVWADPPLPPETTNGIRFTKEQWVDYLESQGHDDELTYLMIARGAKVGGRRPGKLTRDSFRKLITEDDSLRGMTKTKQAPEVAKRLGVHVNTVWKFWSTLPKTEAAEYWTPARRAR